jgi:hypothetical protein
MTAHRNGVGIQRAYDTAAKGATSDPVTRKPTTTLPGSGDSSGQKHNGNRTDAPRVIEVVLLMSMVISRGKYIMGGPHGPQSKGVGQLQ